MMQEILGDSIIAKLLEQYGLTGVLFAVLLMLYIKQGKRLTQLEDTNDLMREKTIEDYKSLIKDYVILVEKNSGVLEKLTQCLASIKETIDRVDRRIEGEK